MLKGPGGKDASKVLMSAEAREGHIRSFRSEIQSASCSFRKVLGKAGDCQKHGQGVFLSTLFHGRCSLATVQQRASRSSHWTRPASVVRINAAAQVAVSEDGRLQAMAFKEKTGQHSP